MIELNEPIPDKAEQEVATEFLEDAEFVEEEEFEREAVKDPATEPETKNEK